MASGTTRRRKAPLSTARQPNASGVPIPAVPGDLVQRRATALRKHFGRAQRPPKGLRLQAIVTPHVVVRVLRLMRERHYSEAEALRRIVEAGLATLAPAADQVPITKLELAWACKIKGKRSEVAKRTRELKALAEELGPNPFEDE